jgi:hypothetical protein
MRHLKILGMTLIAMFALGIMATSASAEQVLPDIHALATIEYPLHLQFNDNGTTPSKLTDVAGNELSGKGLLLLFLLKELSALGEFEVLFLHVEKLVKGVGTPCKKAGEKATGEVLITGTFHIVPLNTLHEDGVLYLFNELEIECGLAKVKVRGAVISTVNYKTVKESEDFTELCGKLEGNGAGKNKLTEYLNDNGTKVKAILEAEFGNGFKQAAEEVGEICPVTLNKGMFSVLQR